MRTLVIFAALALIVFGDSALQAQNQVENSEIEFFVETIAGNPEFCGIDATIIYQDRLTQQGRHAGARVSLTWGENQGNIKLLFKVYGIDFGSDMTSAKKFPIAQAFVTAKGTVVPSGTVFPCEDQSAYCVSYPMPSATATYVGFKSNQLAIGFSRQVGGLDIKLPLDVPAAVELRDDYKKFNQCFGMLIEKAKANLK
jgi:hypothetical protein